MRCYHFLVSARPVCVLLCQVFCCKLSFPLCVCVLWLKNCLILSTDLAYGLLAHVNYKQDSLYTDE
jgi:hypothetical protein